MKTFWVSFHVAEALLPEFEVHTPWWISGGDLNGNAAICMAVQAENEEAVRNFVYASFDNHPMNLKWRFIDECKADWSPFSDRFPQGAWMKWPLTADEALKLRSPAPTPISTGLPY